MTSLKNNPVLDQFRVLLSKAIDLKEKFDTNSSVDILNEFYKFYSDELDKLQRLTPSEIFSKTSLLRHSSFIKIYLKKNKATDCYSDIHEICHKDIHLAEEYYLHYLADNKEIPEKYYDWQNINPVILSISRSRFETLHFSDAVEASFKEINDVVKKYMRIQESVELDGVPLMRKVFASNINNSYTPILKLTDNSTESERNIQEGYMNILVGVMQGVRNPTAHSNLKMEPDEAWELIVLASHLMNKIADKI